MPNDISSVEDTHVDVPHASRNVIRTWAVTSLTGITSNFLIPLVRLEKANSLREKASCYKIKEARRDD